MKRFCIFLIVFLWVGICSVFAQDFIDQKNRNTILGKVLEVTSTEIRYSNSNSLELKISRDDVYTIRYENGRVQVINAVPVVEERDIVRTNRTNSNIATSNVQRTQTATASSAEPRPTTAAQQPQGSGQSTVSASASQTGDLNLVKQALNLVPAIPIAGKNLKFEFGGNDWTAKVNGQNFLSGDCTFQRNGNGYTISLKPTNVWSGAVEEVIDLLQNIGVPLGPAAGPLRTAAKLATKLAKWLPLKGSAIVLDYNEDSPVPLKLKGK